LPEKRDLPKELLCQALKFGWHALSRMRRACEQSAAGTPYVTVRDLAAAKKRKIKMKSKSMKRIKSKRKSRSRISDHKNQSRYSWSHPNLNPNLALTPLPNLTPHPALTLCGAAELRTVI